MSLLFLKEQKIFVNEWVLFLNFVLNITSQISISDSIKLFSD